MLDLTKPLIYRKNRKEHTALLSTLEQSLGDKTIYTAMYIELESTRFVSFDENGYTYELFDMLWKRVSHRPRIFNIPDAKELERKVQLLEKEVDILHGACERLGQQNSILSDRDSLYRSAFKRINSTIEFMKNHPFKAALLAVRRKLYIPILETDTPIEKQVE